MASMRCVLAVLAVLFAVATCAPSPWGWGPKHEHYIIHVPYHVHTVHHHHVKKVHVPVPVYKKVIVHHEPHHHHDDWW